MKLKFQKEGEVLEVDRALLLVELMNYPMQEEFEIMKILLNFPQKPYTLEMAQAFLDTHRSVLDLDYYRLTPIKVRINTPEFTMFDGRLFDRDREPGAFETCVMNAWANTP